MALETFNTVSENIAENTAVFANLLCFHNFLLSVNHLLFINLYRVYDLNWLFMH